MKLIKFLKDKLLFIISQIGIIIFVSVLLSVMKINKEAILLVCLTISVITVVALIAEFMRKYTFYKTLSDTLDQMEKKQYISQLIKEPHFLEGEILVEVLQQVTKAMNDEISSYQMAQEEYREYIETWIHEIKLPIAGIELLCENNKTDFTRHIAKEIKRIEAYVEQALYYARSTQVEKDYSIRKIELEPFIKLTIKKHAAELIACKAEMKLEDLTATVFSDPKWLDFIVGQIISNSIKYRSDTFKLRFFTEELDGQVILGISDNGIGIAQRDLSKVFEKGFTGENGRKYAKSTGIGLYLCKKLCEKMYLGIEVASEVGVGTTVKIIFPKNQSILYERD